MRSPQPTGPNRVVILLPEGQAGAVNQAIVVPVGHCESVCVVTKWVVIDLPNSKVHRIYLPVAVGIAGSGDNRNPGLIMAGGVGPIADDDVSVG